MKRGKLLFISITLLLMLTGCVFKKETDTNASVTHTTTYKLDTEFLTTFEVGEYYRIERIDQTKDSYIIFYDEVNRVISNSSYFVELVKVPEYTQKIELYNIILEKQEFEVDVYPTDQEIKDEEMGGEKPVYVLKEQLVPGRYIIKYRDYLKYSWSVKLFKNNQVINSVSFNQPNYSNEYSFSTNEDFDYLKIYNCSLVLDYAFEVIE